MNEFDIIRRFFDRSPADESAILGIGDDGAVVSVPAGQELVLAMDTLIRGVHFPESTPAADIGWKALAVNLSDLAAMGAEPRWATLSLTVPDADETWLQAFADGFFSLADQYGVTLIGGDLCRGPLVITVQAHGLLPAGQAITRSGARQGDCIYVTGYLGDAGYALRSTESATADYFRQRLNRPQPRIEAGKLIRGTASSAIDISDGLAGDIRHIMQASDCGALIKADKLPISPALQAAEEPAEARHLALTAGDDYELCFTVASEAGQALERRLLAAGESVSLIGKITSDRQLHVESDDGQQLTGYSHF